MTDKVYEVLQKYDAAFCIYALAGYHSPFEITASWTYVRLHGRNYEQWFDSDSRDDRYNYLYSENELSDWKERIEVVAHKAESTYVVTNNHFEAKAGVNALQLKHLLNGGRVKAPDPLLRRYPELKKIADPAADTTDPNLSLLA